MHTVAEAYSGPDCCYFGDREDWYVAASTHRDADCLTRANYAAMLGRLQACDEGDYAQESFSHWAVGHGEYLIVRPGSKAGALAREAEAAMEDYPVLDDEVYSQLEYDEGIESIILAASDYGYGNIDAEVAGYVHYEACMRGGSDDPSYSGVEDYWPSRSVVFAGMLHSRRARGKRDPIKYREISSQEG